MKELVSINQQMKKFYSRESITGRGDADLALWNLQYQRNEKLLRFKNNARAALLIAVSIGSVIMAAHLAGLL